MTTNYMKSFTIGCLLLGLLICLAGTASISWYKKSTECFKDRPPLQGFVLTINRSQQKLLIQQSQEFANKYGFNLDTAFYTPNGEEFLIDMRRQDVEIIIGNNTFHLDEFDVYFYNYNCIHPTVASDIGDLVDDLKNFLREIPDATITEE